MVALQAQVAALVLLILLKLHESPDKASTRTTNLRNEENATVFNANCQQGESVYEV